MTFIISLTEVWRKNAFILHSWLIFNISGLLKINNRHLGQTAGKLSVEQQKALFFCIIFSPDSITSTCIYLIQKTSCFSVCVSFSSILSSTGTPCVPLLFHQLHLFIIKYWKEFTYMKMKCCYYTFLPNPQCLGTLFKPI